jgi:hypothetical protein
MTVPEPSMVEALRATRVLFMEAAAEAPNLPPIARRGRGTPPVWPKGSRGWWLDTVDTVDRLIVTYTEEESP